MNCINQQIFAVEPECNLYDEETGFFLNVVRRFRLQMYDVFQ